MLTAIYFTIAFHLTPLITYFVLKKNHSQSQAVDIGISLLITSSFICDFTGIYMGSHGENTNQVINFYLIISKPIECFILIYPTYIRKNIKNYLVSGGVLISLAHLILCLPSSLFDLNDYTTMLASANVSILALFAIYNLVYYSISLKKIVHPNVIPSIAIFIYNSITFVPTMLTNIDDKLNFPDFVLDLRIWIVITANLLRDTLFVIYFHKKMKVSYDSSK